MAINNSPKKRIKTYYQKKNIIIDKKGNDLLFEMKKVKDIIDVIHEKDLEEFLINIGLYNNFKNKRISCKFCNKVIEENSICALIVKEGNVDFICNSDLCYDKLINFQKGFKDE